MADGGRVDVVIGARDLASGVFRDVAANGAATFEALEDRAGESASSFVSAFAGGIAEGAPAAISEAEKIAAGINEALGVNDTDSEVVAAALDYYQRLAEIEKKYSEDSISYAKAVRDAKVQYASEAFGAASNFMQNLYVATGSQNEAMFETMKAFAIAQTVMDTYRAAQGAYAALAGIPVVGPALGVAAAAAAIAAGAARIAQIQATEPGSTTAISTSGTGYTSYEGGSYESTAEDTTSKSTQAITVNIYNPLSSQNWAEIVENDIIPALNDAADRDIAITINEM